MQCDISISENAHIAYRLLTQEIPPLLINGMNVIGDAVSA